MRRTPGLTSRLRNGNKQGGFRRSNLARSEYITLGRIWRITRGLYMTKDEQDALVFLSQTHRNLHERRIKRSFKIIVSTLTFFVLCVAAKFAADTKLPTSEASFKAVVWITFIALWVV